MLAEDWFNDRARFSRDAGYCMIFDIIFCLLYAVAHLLN